MNLYEVTVPVINVEEAINFYETLGLQLIVKRYPTMQGFYAQ